MAYDDIEDDEYNSLEDTGSTAYFLAEEKRKKKEAEEAEVEKRKNFKVYFCENCGFVFDEEKIGDTVENVLKDSYIQGTCPYCHQKPFKAIERKDLKKLKEKSNKKKKTDIEKKKDIINKNIQYDIKDLLEDLNYRLSSGKIYSKSFINIFYRISLNIAKRYSKDIPGSVDFSSYRKKILELCDPVLDTYSIKEDAESIIENCQEDIEQSKLYTAEYEYYINDDKNAIPDFEMQERIQDYEKEEKILADKEYKKKIEEKYQERRKELEERYQKRKQLREIRNISI